MIKDSYENQFLKVISDKINAETDYKANYGGSRDYFKGHQFLKKNWHFVFVYKKDYKSNFFIESYEKHFADKIQSVFDLYKDSIEALVGRKLYLVPGSRNKVLVRLMIKFDYQDYGLTFEEKIQEYVSTFKKFKICLELIFKYSI